METEVGNIATLNLDDSLAVEAPPRASVAPFGTDLVFAAVLAMVAGMAIWTLMLFQRFDEAPAMPTEPLCRSAVLGTTTPGSASERCQPARLADAASAGSVGH